MTTNFNVIIDNVRVQYSSLANVERATAAATNRTEAAGDVLTAAASYGGTLLRGTESIYAKVIVTRIFNGVHRADCSASLAAPLSSLALSDCIATCNAYNQGNFNDCQRACNDQYL